MQKESIQKIIGKIAEYNKDQDEEWRANIWIITEPQFALDSQGDEIFMNSKEYVLQDCSFEYWDEGLYIEEKRVNDSIETQKEHPFVVYHHFWPYKVILALTTEY